MEKEITWVTDLTDLYRLAYGEYAVSKLVGELFAHVPQDVINRLASEAREEMAQHVITQYNQEDSGR
jgi:hypothetical protein